MVSCRIVIRRINIFDVRMELDTGRICWFLFIVFCFGMYLGFMMDMVV